MAVLLYSTDKFCLLLYYYVEDVKLNEYFKFVISMFPFVEFYNYLL